MTLVTVFPVLQSLVQSMRRFSNIFTIVWLHDCSFLKLCVTALKEFSEGKPKAAKPWGRNPQGFAAKSLPQEFATVAQTIKSMRFSASRPDLSASKATSADWLYPLADWPNPLGIADIKLANKASRLANEASPLTDKVSLLANEACPHTATYHGVRSHMYPY